MTANELIALALTIVFGALVSGSPLLFATIGEIFSERAGVMFSADPSTGDNNIYSFLADLGVSPNGLSYSRKEFLIGSQNCYYGGYFLEFGPQDSTPQWLSTLNLCSPWYGQMWLNGVKFANGIIWNGAGFAIGPDGARHVVYAATTVYYSNGSGPGTPIPDMSRIDPGTGQPLPLQVNRFSGDVQVVVDPSNVVHVFARVQACATASPARPQSSRPPGPAGK